MPTIVGVRFKPTGKTYYFDPTGISFVKGDGVIVETARGAEYAVVSVSNQEVPESMIVGELKPVKSKASAADTERYEQNQRRKADIMQTVRQRIEAHGLDMHLKDMEFSYDNSKMIFYYAADDRVDFRELVKDLGYTLKTRIELRQIGIRDETKMLGGLGSCGRPCCCSAFLNGFERVSIKMAKVQGLSLNPANISGLCGRLMCCLKYENEHYSETAKLMPKVNSTVDTPDGKGVVESLDMVRRMVKVRFTDADGGIVFNSFGVEELNLAPHDIDDEISADEITADVEGLVDDDAAEIAEPKKSQPDKKQPKRHVADKKEDKRHGRKSSRDESVSNAEEGAAVEHDKESGQARHAAKKHRRDKYSHENEKNGSVDTAERHDEHGGTDFSRDGNKPFKRKKKHKPFDKNKTRDKGGESDVHATRDSDGGQE